MKIYLFCFFLLFSLSCQTPSHKDGLVGNNQSKSTRNPIHSTVFNQSFEQVLTAYLQLKDQLVAEKDSGIAQATRALVLASDSLKLSELQADSILVQTAFSYSDGISSEAQGLLGENNLLSKRRSFQMISDQLYDLIRTVQYQQKPLYRFYCNNAFEDQGAYWISDQTGLTNPYQPNLKPLCGEIKDTISVATN
jgi:Cu(I)/Ag(I) efflux system membrane fusion protein